MAQQQKISRKELLKKDEFVGSAPDIIDWLEANRNLVIRSVIGIVVVALAVGAWSLWNNHRKATSAALLDEGLRAYRPLVPPGATEAPAPKLAEALAAFEKAADRGGRAGVGATASFYRASALIDLGRPAEASPILEQVIASAPTLSLAASAHALLATAFERAGDVDRAAGVLTQLAEDADGVFPADAALLRLASLREGQGKIAEAKQAYQDVLTRFPEGPSAGEARAAAQRLEGLVP